MSLALTTTLPWVKPITDFPSAPRPHQGTESNVMAPETHPDRFRLFLGRCGHAKAKAKYSDKADQLIEMGDFALQVQNS